MKMVFSDDYINRSLSEDIEILERIISSFHFARESKELSNINVTLGGWSKYGWEARQQPIYKALLDSDIAGLHKILSKFFIDPSAYGIALGKDEFDAITSNKNNTNNYLNKWTIILHEISYLLNAKILPNPEIELYNWNKRYSSTIEELVNEIEKKTLLPISFPQICGVFGPNIRGNAIPELALHYYLVAEWCKQLVFSYPANVIEIGGGFGGLAFYMANQNNLKYTIYDLDFGTAIQAYFLNRALPPESITLFGESKLNSFRLYPSWCLLSQKFDIFNQEVSLLINQDCLTEVDPSIAKKYSESLTKRINGFVLSIGPDRSGSNIDWKGCPAGYFFESISNLKRIERSHYNLRPGYMRELFMSR